MFGLVWVFADFVIGLVVDGMLNSKNFLAGLLCCWPLCAIGLIISQYWVVYAFLNVVESAISAAYWFRKLSYA